MSHEKQAQRKQELKESHEGGNRNCFFGKFLFIYTFVPTADTGPDQQREKKKKNIIDRTTK